MKHPRIPYIRKRHAHRMPASICAYCGKLTKKQKKGSAPVAQFDLTTKDHILAKQFGVVEVSGDSGVRVTRPCCGGCNNLRAVLGHCVGALMLAVIEGRHRGIDKYAAAGELQMISARRARSLGGRG